jgi:hypothetical protein
MPPLAVEEARLLFANVRPVEDLWYKTAVAVQLDRSIVLEQRGAREYFQVIVELMREAKPKAKNEGSEGFEGEGDGEAAGDETLS